MDTCKNPVVGLVWQWLDRPNGSFGIQPRYYCRECLKQLGLEGSAYPIGNVEPPVIPIACSNSHP